MSAPCDNFDRVNEFIQEVYQNVEDSRHLFQFVCSDTHKLLQPWPSKSEHEDSDEYTENHKKNGRNVDTGRASDGAGRSDKDKQKEDDEMFLSEEEAKALADVDDILSKAQHARKLQAKVSKSTTKKARTHLTSSPTRKQDIPQNVAIAATHPKTHDQIQTECGTKGQNTQPDSDTAVISASRLQSLLSSTTSKPSRHSSTQNARKSKHNLSTNGIPSKPPGPTSLRTGVKVPRPTSASKMQYKTSSSEIGKHMVKSRKPPSGLTAQRQREKPEQKSSFKKTKPLNRSHSFERSTSGDMKQPLVRTQSEESRSNVRSINHVNSAQSKRTQDASVESMSWSSDDRESGVADLVEETDRMVLTGSASSFQTEEESLMESQPFLLKRDGSTLKIPVKLKKLHSSAEKLREKLRTPSSHESDSVENHFKMRLESKFSRDSSFLSLKDLEVKLNQLHAESSQLCLVAKELQQIATSITGTCTWQEIYRTKALLQTITARYNELQHEILQLKKVEKALLSKCNHKTPPAAAGTKKHKRNLSLPIPPSTPWLQTACRNMSPMSDGAGASSGCSSMFPSSAGLSSSVMQYNKVKDMKRLMGLQYQAQFVMWQMDIEKLIAEDILPILQNMDPADPEFIPLYRTIYGLLCHSGETYPSLIKDNIGGSDEEENGEHG